ncbi:hypothetical protein LCGC14_0273640 [marine sediment metagenome]
MLLNGERVPDGYIRIDLRDMDRRERIFVHRLVLLAFVGPCPEGMEGCHTNDVGEDNHLTNLRWGTPAENREDARRNGRILYGDKNPRASVTDEQRKEVKRLAGTMSHRRIAQVVGMPYSTVGHIIRGTDRKKSPCLAG